MKNKLPKDCLSKEDGICKFQINSCQQCFSPIEKPDVLPFKNQLVMMKCLKHLPLSFSDRKEIERQIELTEDKIRETLYSEYVENFKNKHTDER